MNAPTTFPAPGVVPVRTWQARRSDEVAVQAWRVIANAGPKGIGAADLRARMNNMDADVMKQLLHELRRKGHARFDSPTGSTRVGVWVATATPWPTEHPPLWQQQPANESLDSAADQKAEDAHAEADKMVANAAMVVPNSVFALGTPQARSFGVDIDAAHMPAAHLQALAAVAPAPVAPAPAPAPEPTPVPDINVPGPDLEPEPDAAAEPAAVLVALDSRGRLLVHEAPEPPVLLSPHATRALFRYLDSTVLGYVHASLLQDALP